MQAEREQVPLLRAEHLYRRIGERVLVDDVSFSVARSELLALIGPSGAGKSSLLRLLNRLDEPTSGTVFLDDQDYLSMPPRELRRRVGMVLQSPFLFPGSVAENLRFGPRQHGEALPDDRLEWLLERVGLGGYAERDVGRLSGGEAQRVSLARTLANRPEVLLLDEPTSALDDVAEREVERLLASIIREQQIACVMVTHDLAQAGRIATRVMVLQHGAQTANGAPKEILHAHQLPDE